MIALLAISGTFPRTVVARVCAPWEIGKQVGRLPLLALVAAVGLVVTASIGARFDNAVSVCPKKDAVFKGTYHSARFRLLARCQAASGVIRLVKREPDGDLHMQLELDPGQEKLLNTKNMALQRGRLVLELMPRDAGHIPKPACGWRVRVVGVWVEDDTQPRHGWNEIHPIWKLTHAGKSFISGPQFGGDPDSARSKTAKALCQTETGTECPGYPPGQCGVH